MISGSKRIRAAWIFTGTRFIRGGEIIVTGDERGVRVLSAGPSSSGRASLDLSSAVVTPGLVNAHTHLDISASGIDNLGRGDGMINWIRRLREVWPPAAGASAAGRMKDGMRSAGRAMRAAGTTAVGDHSGRFETYDLLHAEGFSGVVYREIIGPSEMPDLPPFPSSDLELGIAPHAPHTVKRALIEGLAGFGGRISIHIAESPEEMELYRGAGGAMRDLILELGIDEEELSGLKGGNPIGYLDSAGIIGPNLTLVHCVHLARDDLALIRRRGASAVICPRSNESIGVGLPDLPAMIETGILPALGTDSPASNTDLDARGEAARILETWPEIVTPQMALRMLTREGGLALGRPDLGVIEPGSRGGLIAWDSREARTEEEAAMAVITGPSPPEEIRVG